MEESKKWYLPIWHEIRLSTEMCHMKKFERDRMERIPYALAIRSIMYVMIYTRPNVSDALSIISRYQSNID